MKEKNIFEKEIELIMWMNGTIFLSASQLTVSLVSWMSSPW